MVGHAYGDRLVGNEYLQIWRMPLFFFLTGYFWSHGRSFGFEAKNRWLTLGVPYLVWAVLMSIVAWVWTRDEPEEFGGLMWAGWYGGADQVPPWWAFWFISVLFFVTLLRRWLERYPAWVPWAVVGVGLMLAEIPESALARTPLGVGLALPCLFFVLAGELFRYHVQPRITRHRALTGTAMVVAGVLAVWLGVDPLNVKFSGFGTFLLSPVVGVVMAAGMVLIFATVIERVLRSAARPVTAVVRTGTLVVLMHGWVLIELLDVGIDTEPQRTIATLLICWIIGVLVNLTPLSRALAGVPTPAWWRRLLERREHRGEGAQTG